MQISAKNKYLHFYLLIWIATIHLHQIQTQTLCWKHSAQIFSSMSLYVSFFFNLISLNFHIYKQTYLLQDGYKRKQYRYSEFHIVYTTLMPLCFLIKQQLYHFNLFCDILNVGFLSILSWSPDYRYMDAALGHKTLIGMCRLFSLCWCTCKEKIRALMITTCLHSDITLDTQQWAAGHNSVKRTENHSLRG